MSTELPLDRAFRFRGDWIVLGEIPSAPSPRAILRRHVNPARWAGLRDVGPLARKSLGASAGLRPGLFTDLTHF